MAVVCVACDTGAVRTRNVTTLLRGYRDEQETILFQWLLEVSPPESSLFAEAL